MTDRQLRKQSRLSLLKMLLEQKKENESLQLQLQEARQQLQSRQVDIEQSGTLAEAALKLSGIFEAAEVACQQYTENIRNLSGRQEEICRKMEQETREKCERQVAEAQSRSAAIEAEARAKADLIVSKAEADSKAYWDDVSKRLDKFYNEHAGLRELLSMVYPKKDQDEK